MAADIKIGSDHTNHMDVGQLIFKEEKQMIINHNISAMNTNRQMGINNLAGSKAMEKLSSGLRINRAGDDAAGLTISEKMRAQIRGLDQASRNSQDGISLIQTAEGALNETHNILQRMRELADQSANGTNTAEDRAAIQDEIKQLKDEIDRIGNTTEFNTMKLLNGNLKAAGEVAVGQNTTTGAIVAKQTAASKTMSQAFSTGALSSSNFIAETIKIDGTDITVNWQNLDTTERNILTSAAGGSTEAMNAAKDLIINKINEAIDAQGGKVAHVTGYVDSATKKLTLQSGSKGVDSSIESSTASAVLSTLHGDTLSAASGTSVYNGTSVSDKINFQIGEVRLQTSTALSITNGTAMSTAANELQTKLNDAISSYNTLQGKQAGDEGYIEQIKVNAGKDGRFEIVSEYGPVSFSSVTGSTAAEDLGLSQAQTDASGNGGMTFQIGANRGQTITFGIGDMRSAALGVAGVDLSTQSGSSVALDKLDKAISTVSKQRSSLGAVQNRLEHTISNLNNASENLQAAESRIRDVDMAKEVMEMTRANILGQASQAMLAQANQKPQSVLQLLG